VGDVNMSAAAGVSAIRQGALQPGISRIVVDMTRPVAISSAFILPASQGLPDRLVIDFADTPRIDAARIFGRLAVGDSAPPPVAAAPPSGAAGTLGTISIPRPVPAARQQAAAITRAPDPDAGDTPASARPARKPESSAARAADGEATGKHTVVIDAGHGGVDPGAIGSNGVFEKNVTLAMARELKQQLEETGRYTVFLTRDSDKFLKLYQRVDIARAKKADLFISLHADTIGKSSVRGASVYTLSEKASDQETAELADRENKADLIAGADLSHADKDVASILVDLSMRDTMNQSKFFANTLVDKLRGDGIRVLESPHRYAGFAVLKAPDVPSILMEIGYMSNASEVRLLNDPAHRRKLGAALRKGVDAYFEQVRRNSRT
jgi:N-acetylmuramoyl-L-alanine amidase